MADTTGDVTFPNNLIPQLPRLPEETKPIDTSEKMEELHAYLTNLDRLEVLFNPTAEDDRWEIASVKSHKVVKHPQLGNRIMVKIQYKDGDTVRKPLDVVRMHDPMVCAQYAIEAGLTHYDEWKWVHHYLETNPVIHALTQVFRAAVGQPHSQLEQVVNPPSKKSQRVNPTLHTSKKYKFGVEVPRNVKHALSLDKENGTTGWKQAIDTEMNQLNEYKTFKLIPRGEPVPQGYKRIPHHIVFDVKFDGRLKACLVAGGHRTPHVDPEEVFSGVVSMEAVRFGFIMARMNGLIVCAGDIGNAFLYGTTREKVYIIAGPEFGPDLEGEHLIVYKALYGLKTSAARFHEHLSAKLRRMAFRPSKSDPDMWIRKESDGSHNYVARFVDDVIVFSQEPMNIIEELKATYIMKGVGKPQYYLGGDVVDLGPRMGTRRNNHCTYLLSTYIQNCLPKIAKMCGKEQFGKV